MKTVKTSVTIPDELYREARALSKNFSAIVSKALKEYIHAEKIMKAIGSFGKWEEREASSVEIVNMLREEDGRRHTDRSG